MSAVRNGAEERFSAPEPTDSHGRIQAGCPDTNFRSRVVRKQEANLLDVARARKAVGHLRISEPSPDAQRCFGNRLLSIRGSHTAFDKVADSRCWPFVPEHNPGPRSWRPLGERLATNPIVATAPAP